MASLEKDIVSFWQFDSAGATMEDKKGLYDLTHSGTAATLVTGPSGQATFFDAYNTKYYNTTPTKLVHKGDRTYAFWHRLNDAATSLGKPINFVSPTPTYYHLVVQIAGDNQYAAAAYKGAIAVGYRTQGAGGSALDDKTDPGTVTDANWHFYVVMYSPSTPRTIIYMDNTLVLDVASKVTDPETHSTVLLSVGPWTSAALDVYDQGIWGLGCWNRLLTGPEITRLYKGDLFERWSGKWDRKRTAENPSVSPSLRQYLGHLNDQL